jgi:LacI family transcriptional regulator
MTIHDIAALAGVSAGTVSRVINDRDGVGRETRQRIAAIVEANHFTLNATAQHLSTGRAGAIGVAFPFQASQLLANGIYPVLLASVADAAQEAGYDIMLVSMPAAKGVHRVTDAVRRHRIDGVILPAAGRHDLLLRSVLGLDVPAVVIGHRTTSTPWVDSCHDLASYELTARMITHGRRRLAFINGPPDVSACKLRSKGFWSAVKDHNAEVDTAEEHEVGFDPERMRAKASQFVSSRRRKPPTAIVGATDAVAAVYLDVAREHGLEAPEDFLISGFDDLPLSAHTSPPLTTVRMPLEASGATATAMLVDLIEGRPLPKRRVVLQTELVLRQSTEGLAGVRLPPVPDAAVVPSG